MSKQPTTWGDEMRKNMQMVLSAYPDHVKTVVSEECVCKEKVRL